MDKLAKHARFVADELDELLARKEAPWEETLVHWRDLLRSALPVERKPAPKRKRS